jgi:two-component system copper resistance phosphate regulon response regulator CusR
MRVNIRGQKRSRPATHGAIAQQISIRMLRPKRSPLRLRYLSATLGHCFSKRVALFAAVFEQPKRALVVEDEAKTAAFLRDGLQDQGWKVDIAKDGSEGLRLARSSSHDLLLLDIMLPTLDGWTILQRLRAEAVLTPVIFLTARDELADRIKGLDLGADDYLVKPFAFSELLARIRSILRRGPDRLPTKIRIAELEINLVTHVVTRGPRQLELTQKEFALLVLLTRSAGETLGRKFIAKEVWNMDSEGDSNLVDVAIRRLRRKVDFPFPKPLIHSVYGAGYVLEPR